MYGMKYNLKIIPEGEMNKNELNRTKTTNKSRKTTQNGNNLHKRTRNHNNPM